MASKLKKVAVSIPHNMVFDVVLHKIVHVPGEGTFVNLHYVDSVKGTVFRERELAILNDTITDVITEEVIGSAHPGLAGNLNALEQGMDSLLKGLADKLGI